MKNKLYVIGNGFDLYHGLKTGVNDFKKKLVQKNIYNHSTDALDLFEGYGVNWGEYENSLSSIDLNIIEELNLTSPDYSSDRESDRDGTIFNMEEHLNSLSNSVSESLNEMIGEVNDSIYSYQPLLKNLLQSGDVIINFNYTLTIEALYNLSENIKMLYIHGSYENKDELIFGYKSQERFRDYEEKSFNTLSLQRINEEISKKNENNKLYYQQELSSLNDEYDNLIADRDFYIDKQRELILDFHKSFKKKIKIEALKDFLDEVRNIDEIRVLGHSMSETDLKYMELIEEILNPNSWYISQHENNPNTDSLNKYSFKSKVKFFNMDNFKLESKYKK